MALLPKSRIRRPSRLLCATPDLGRRNSFDHRSLAHLAHIPRRAASDLLIRSSGQVVQDRPSMVVGWADIPGLSTCVGCCSAAWLQSWLQSRRNGADPRPSAFQAGHIPSLRESCESYALSPVADDSGWLLLLLSSLLPADGPVPHLRGLPPDDSVTSRR